MHAILLQKSSENKTLAHGRRSSVFLSDQPLQTMFASSLLGVLAGSSAGKHFQRGAGSEKAVCGFCEDFFCRCSSLRAFPSSMHWFRATSSLWIHHNMWPSLSWEVKNTDLLSPRRERARRTARAEPDQHLPQLYLSWEMHRNLKIQQYISEALYLGFNSSKNRPAFLRQNSLEHLLHFKEAIQYKLLCVQCKNAMFFIENARLLQGLKW